MCFCLSPCSPLPPPQRMHCFGKATLVNVCYLCCHGCALQLCRWRRANNFFQPPSGRLPSALFIPIAVGFGPPMGTPPSPKQHQRLQQRPPGQQRKKKQQEKPLLHMRPRQKKQEHEKHWWRAWPWQRCKCNTTCISAPRRVETRWQSRPSSAPALGWPGTPRLPSPVSEPWGGLKILGSSPPPSRWPCCSRPFRKNGVEVCSFLGVTPQVRN